MTSTTPFFMFLATFVCLALILPAQAQEQPFNASIAGERNIGQWYNFTIENVSGLKDASYHYVVYRAYFKDYYTYRDENWGLWLTQAPDAGKKYLFVWVLGYLDSSSTDWWGWDQDRFPVWYNTSAISPEPIAMVSSQFGGTYYGVDHPRLISGMENISYFPHFTWSGDAYGYVDGIQSDRLIAGPTNAMQGYVIYQVPETVTLSDLRVAMITYTDQIWWNLENKTYQQVDDVARKQQQDQEQIQEQILQGLRLPDNFQRIEA